MEMVKIADHKRFATEDQEFVFLTGTGSIFELEADSEVRKIFDHDISNRSFTKTEFHSIMKSDLAEGSGKTLSSDSVKDPSETDDLWNELAAARVLTPAVRPTNKREVAYQEMPVNTLVLHVTESCNLMCRYCYHEPGKRDNSMGGPPTPQSMEWTTARKAVDFLFDRCGDLKKLVLVFFGGEPLLNFKLISKTIAYADDKAKAEGKKIDYAMTTNGTLLSDKIISLLKEHTVGLTVSLDGDENAHDRFRRFPDGSPSYGVILPGLKKLLEKRDAKPVVARVTLAQDITDLSATLHHLLDLGFAEVGFAPVTTCGSDYQLDAFQMNRLLEAFQSLSEQFVAWALENRFLGFTNLVDLLVNLHEGEVRRYPCGAGMGMFAVDPKGDLFLCQRLTHDDSAQMGDLVDGFDQKKLATFRQHARLDKKAACKGCWAASICAGGCYHEAAIRQGNLLSPNLHYCQWIKAWIETGLNVYGRLTKEAPHFLDNLSMLRGHEPLYDGKLI